jgi:hypothetical protein
MRATQDAVVFDTYMSMKLDLFEIQNPSCVPSQDCPNCLFLCIKCSVDCFVVGRHTRPFGVFVSVKWREKGMVRLLSDTCSIAIGDFQLQPVTVL